MEGLKTGDTVYAINVDWRNCPNGIVQTVIGVQTEAAAKAGYVVCNDKNYMTRPGGFAGRAYGTVGRPEENIFATPNEAWEALMGRIEEYNKDLKEKYREEIQSLEELIRFPLSHCICGDEDLDSAAREVYEERAKEIMAELKSVPLGENSKEQEDIER